MQEKKFPRLSKAYGGFVTFKIMHKRKKNCPILQCNELKNVVKNKKQIIQFISIYIPLKDTKKGRKRSCVGEYIFFVAKHSWKIFGEYLNYRSLQKLQKLWEEFVVRAQCTLHTAVCRGLPPQHRLREALGVLSPPAACHCSSPHSSLGHGPVDYLPPQGQVVGHSSSEQLASFR